MAARSTFKISDDVRDVLARSTITATSVTLPEQLEPALYRQVNKALMGAGGKWDRKAKAHVFDRDPREVLGLAVETGQARNLRTEFQAFYTPDALADRVVAATGMAQHPDVLSWKAGKFVSNLLVLEPSIGAGALAAAVMRATAGNAFVTGVDIDEMACKSAVARMVAERKARKGKFVVSSYDGPPRWQGDDYSIWQADFLKMSRKDSHGFDYIVTNPPFAKGAYIKHIIRAWDFLDDGGTLAAITWPGWQTGTTKPEVAFRELVEAHKVLVEDIAPGTFEHTDMPTVLVVLRKPAPPEEPDEDPLPVAPAATTAQTTLFGEEPTPTGKRRKAAAPA